MCSIYRNKNKEDKQINQESISKPSEKKIKFIISKFISTTIEFSDHFVEYKGKLMLGLINEEVKIYYKDIIGLSYHSIRNFVNYVFIGQNYQIDIWDTQHVIHLRFSSGRIDNQKKTELFHQIVYVVEQVIKPFLFVNLINQLKNTGQINIGPITITIDGIKKERFLRGPELLLWHNYERCIAQNGYMVIYKRDNKSNQSKLFETIPLSEMNAVILPEIFFYLKENQIRKGTTTVTPEKEKNIDIVYCSNCGNKTSVEAYFCRKCGYKLRNKP